MAGVALPSVCPNSPSLLFSRSLIRLKKPNLEPCIYAVSSPGNNSPECEAEHGASWLSAGLPLLPLFADTPAPAPLTATQVPPSPAPSASPPATLSPSAWTWLPSPAHHPRVGTSVHMQPGTRCQLGVTSSFQYPDPDLGVSERMERPHPCRGTSRLQGSQTLHSRPSTWFFLLCPQFPTWQVDMSASLLSALP